MGDREGKTDGRETRMANRQDLFCIASFLDRLLPDARCYEVHQYVLSALNTASPAYRIYFQPASIEDSYSAIVGINAEHCVLPNKQTQKTWILCAWHVNDEDLIRVLDCLDEVDWNRDLIAAFLNEYSPSRAFSDYLTTKCPQLNGVPEGVRTFPVDRYFLEAPAALKAQINLPPGVYVKSLERRHAQTVFDYWLHAKSTTVEYVADEIERLPSAGVFLKDTDKLVAWMMSHPPNGMSRLFTLDECRRQGYASALTLYLSKRMAQCGYIPFVNIEIYNEASKKFFESCGFRFLRKAHVCVVSAIPF